MILDLSGFVSKEKPFWDELAALLSRLDRDPGARLSLADLRRFHYLHQRASADLGKLATFASEPELLRYLESLVSASYGEIHESRVRQGRVNPLRWLFRAFPEALRRNAKALALSVSIFLGGAAFGAGALAFDPASKAVLLPFGHLQGDPRERVAQEEKAGGRASGGEATFSSYLMQHNIRVSLLCLALGATLGLGTAVFLFYNGIILGAVALDYVSAGQGVFLLGWLLPHGVVEIPAMLIAGQAGFVLASALIGWGDRNSLALRLRASSDTLVSLVAGLSAMLIWAGLVEAFLSQYHAPVLPYGLKIAFGVIEGALLVSWLLLAGDRASRPQGPKPT